MYDAKLPQTIAERDAFAKTRSMSVEEVLGSEDLRKVLSEIKSIGWRNQTGDRRYGGGCKGAVLR